MEEEKVEWKAPAKIEELFSSVDGSMVAGWNKPTSGARSEKDVEFGDAPYQLYSVASPNGQKIGIMLEELGVKYDAHKVNLMNLEQFTSGFVKINPNEKIPALVDQTNRSKVVNIWESNSILLYLAEKHKKFIPEDFVQRTEVMNWLIWQCASAPYIGQFAHFFRFAPRDKIDLINYGVARYGMEIQRLLSVLDKQLEKHEYICEWGYSIADIATFTYVRAFGAKGSFNTFDFLSFEKYKNVQRWLDLIEPRQAVQRGLVVTPF